MSKYILGGGIAGLITAYYNPQYTIISDKIGGQMADTGLGPRILEINDNSTKLLYDLGFEKIGMKVASVGYMINGRYISNLDNEQKINYYMKSRCLESRKNIPSSIMSDGKKHIRYWDIDWNDLIYRLMDGIQSTPIIGKISHINTEKKKLKVDGITLEYDTLVSTIPAPLFFKLANEKPYKELTFVNKTFIIVPEFFDMKHFDYVYFPGPDVEYHRVTKLDNDRFAIEYTTHRSSEDILGEWPDALNVKTLFAGQIQSGEIKVIDDVYYIGRFGCWDHDIKTDDVVFQANLLKGIEEDMND